jgi:hypothetical protein
MFEPGSSTSTSVLLQIPMMELLVGVVFATAPASGPVPTVRVSTLRQEAYSFDADPCPNKKQALSDSPPRSFRNRSGTIHLYSSESRGARASIGTEIKPAMERDCAVFYNSTTSGCDPDPSMYDGSEWVQGAAVAPDGSVHALVHNEWHPDPGTPAHKFANCSKPDCWISFITMVVSRDGGQTFQHSAPPPHHLVVSMPGKYHDGLAGTGNGMPPFGFQNPSNIMRSPKDGFYYALVSTWGVATTAYTQQSGNCLIRIKDLNDPPNTWRAWGGAGFTVSMNANPYTHDGALDPSAHVCAPVSHTNEYLSLVWSTLLPAVPHGLWRRRLQNCLLQAQCRLDPLGRKHSDSPVHMQHAGGLGGLPISH